MSKPSYATNAPQGWGGDWRRGAPMGRGGIYEHGKEFSGKLTLRRTSL